MTDKPKCTLTVEVVPWKRTGRFVWVGELCGAEIISKKSRALEAECWLDAGRFARSVDGRGVKIAMKRLTPKNAISYGPGGDPRLTADEWMALVLAWAASFPQRPYVDDDSREACYGPEPAEDAVTVPRGLLEDVLGYLNEQFTDDGVRNIRREAFFYAGDLIRRIEEAAGKRE